MAGERAAVSQRVTSSLVRCCSSSRPLLPTRGTQRGEWSTEWRQSRGARSDAGSTDRCTVFQTSAATAPTGHCACGPERLSTGRHRGGLLLHAGMYLWLQYVLQTLCQIMLPQFEWSPLCADERCLLQIAPHDRESAGQRRQIRASRSAASLCPVRRCVSCFFPTGEPACWPGLICSLGLLCSLARGRPSDSALSAEEAAADA